LRLGVEPPVEMSEVIGDRVTQRPRRVVEDPGDLAQRQADPAQEADPVEPLDISVGVQTMPGRRPCRRRHKPDLLVVVQRPDGQASGDGELSYLPTRFASGHDGHGMTVRPDAT
jgi:hypothetical protein